MSLFVNRVKDRVLYLIVTYYYPSFRLPIDVHSVVTLGNMGVHFTYHVGTVKYKCL